MKEAKVFFRLFLCLLFAVSSVYCSRKPASECDSKKIQLLLEDILSKEHYFYACKMKIFTFGTQNKIPPDSSMYFGYLIARNLNVPNKAFYLHWNRELAPDYPDSLKLKVINDISEMDACTFVVGVYIKETNEDSTKMKIELGYGFARTADEEMSLTYSFDRKYCKWTVLDSTITYY